MSQCRQREVPACLVELRALQVVDFSHNRIRSLGDQFERMVNLHTLELTGNNDLDLDGLPIRTRRLHEKVRHTDVTLPFIISLVSSCCVLVVFSNNCLSPRPRDEPSSSALWGCGTTY
jgi:hypothetical protein